MDNRGTSPEAKTPSEDDARKKWDDEAAPVTNKRATVKREPKRVFTDWASI